MPCPYHPPLFTVLDTRKKVTSGGRKLHNVELHNFFPRNAIRRLIKYGRMGWSEYLARMEAILIAKPEGKR
jgi:hypothetical protein